jgi:protein-S-isoprenylcysteine O-methyltransferase Ste14
MPLYSIVILSAFSGLGIALTAAGYLVRDKNKTVFGKPAINPILFYSGKVTLFTSWIFFILKAILPGLDWIEIISPLPWSATLLLSIGSLIMIISFFSLGNALTVGLPDENTTLKTRGLYGLSRNPLYVGVFFINIAACLFFPNPINIACSVYGIYIHHLITLGEEKFLLQRFGKDWEAYRREVGRYL